VAKWPSWLGGKAKPSKRLIEPSAAAPPAEVEPVHLANANEVFLQSLIADVAAGRRRAALASDELLNHLGELWNQGHERLAMEWMEKLLLVPDVAPEATMRLRAALVERYDQRRDVELCLVHAEVLTTDPIYALRAHSLLADYAYQRGDNATALRHYEAVLVRDVQFPNALLRVERLRAALGRTIAAPGETIAGGDLRMVDSGGRYRLIRELGRGATGAVYVARDTELERDVAVKLLHPHLASDQKAAALSQFFREARVTASLRHPNIVAVLDLDERARRIVMELAAGGTMRDVLRDRGRRSPRRAIERHVQILSALAAAHRNGIIHRDLKPANLMFRRDPDLPGVEVMLGDFGVAHLPDQERNREQPRVRDAVGTLAYMAPEQRRGEVSPAVDIYASAVVLYEMLHGRLPWSREQVLAHAHQQQDFVLQADVFADVPSVFESFQHHLKNLAGTDPSTRPSAEHALLEAQQLRVEIIAATA
jgi:hypothetical protein